MSDQEVYLLLVRALLNKFGRNVCLHVDLLSSLVRKSPGEILEWKKRSLQLFEKRVVDKVGSLDLLNRRILLHYLCCQDAQDVLVDLLQDSIDVVKAKKPRGVRDSEQPRNTPFLDPYYESKDSQRIGLKEDMLSSLGYSYEQDRKTEGE